jgi:hypothetical protein
VSRVILLALCLFASLTSFSQTATFRRPTNFTYVYQTLPIAVPTSPTGVSVLYPNGTTVKGDLYVCYLDLSGTGQTVTIQDRQATPVTWLSVAAIGTSAASATQIFNAASDSTCRWMPNGITWSASASGVTGYLIVKFN